MTRYRYLRFLCSLSIIIAGLLVLQIVELAQPALADGDTADSLFTTQIDRLDAKTLEPGRHHFLFKAGTRPGGTPLLVPVIVIKGQAKGPRLLLIAGVHGDELNGIAALHDLAATLNADTLKGTVVMIPGLNQPGIEQHSRFFPLAESGGSQVDLNRIMPGKRPDKSPAEFFASKVWQNLMKPNADLVIDLHTQSRGTSYPLFVFSDFRNSKARRMAIDLMPDVIKDDAGEKGTVETSFIAQGIPAVTFEIGAPKRFQPALVSRAVDGIRNVMISEKMLDEARLTPQKKPYVGTKVSNIIARRGGIARIKVELLDKVTKGDTVAKMYDPFGSLIDTYVAPHDGMVLAIATDPIREPASLLVRILR